MDRRGFLGGAIAGAASFASVQSAESKGELKQSQYAVVEMMGYKKLCGRLSQGIGGLLQLDSPVEGGMVTMMINPSSIYKITLVDEKTVKALAVHTDPLPLMELEIQPRQSSLAYNEEY